jgi:hypothetical protein
MPKSTFEKELSHFYSAAHAENGEHNGAILFGVSVINPSIKINCSILNLS